MLKQVQELQQYLKDKKIPISGVKKDLVHRVKIHQDSISRQRGGLGEGGCHRTASLVARVVAKE
jgi:hypothetical protein